MTTSTARRRGRPPRAAAAAEDARTRILEAARELFVQRGYEGVSMRAVAERAGCATGTLYTAFPSKRALLRRVWEAAFEDLDAALTAAIAGAAGPLDRLRALLVAQVEFWRAHPDPFRAIFLIEDQVSAPDDRYFVDSSPAAGRILALTLEAITAAQASGELAAGDPGEMLEVFFAGVHGAASLLITVPEFPWSDPDALASRMVETLLRGAAAQVQA